MDEKPKSNQRKNRLMRHLPSDDQQHEQQQEQQQQQYCSHGYQRLIPLSTYSFLPSASVLPKRRRCSITNDSIPTTNVEDDFIYERSSILGMSGRKRPAQDDMATANSQHLLREQHHSNKRPRYEYSRSIELENQPPRSSTFSHQSPLIFQSTEVTRRSSTWSNLPIQHDVSPFFQDLSLPLSRPTTSVASASVVYHERDSLSIPYSPLLGEDHHRLHHASSTFTTNPLRISAQKSTNDKDQMRLLSPQSNENCPLRTTNFLLDNKQEQQIILRTGNVSPAHSDSSSESTSTCSSDEQPHHRFGPFCSQNHQLIAQAQPWRTYRERENYEQLIDLAEKLSDPNRFKQVDVQQFFSYRYKADPITSEAPSKQTACVICMSHFKNGQRIRVLPCQHEYHSKCIARWFTMNSSCPICRRDNFLLTN